VSYLPPSPNASALLRYVNFPVNTYSGIPEIEIPIAELPGRRLKVPVTASYHASGNKVQDIASWIGLGFSLNAGGVITRIVRGLPDEDVNGYCGTNNIGEKAYQTVNSTYVSNVAGNTWDGEPDIFYYNFLGRTGKFILDETGAPVLIPYSDIKIQPAICGGNGSWIITDEGGNIYTFGKDVYSRESSTCASKTYTSSWYLSEMNTSDGTLNSIHVLTGYYGYLSLLYPRQSY